MVSIGKTSAGVALIGIVLCGIGTAHATTAEQKCQEQKLKAQGKLELCLKKNSAKILGGKPDESATCQVKFSAALAKAGTCQYVDNGDGTVSDLNTGLQWEKKNNQDGISNDANPHDVDNYYTWSASGSAPDGTAFTDFLAQLNNGASIDGAPGTAITGCFAGHCDWRLPTIVELQGIVDTTQGECSGASFTACIDPVFGPTQAFFHVSGTIFFRFSGSTAWGVFFDDGSISNLDETQPYCVRAVRGGL